MMPTFILGAASQEEPIRNQIIQCVAATGIPWRLEIATSICSCVTAVFGHKVWPNFFQDMFGVINNPPQGANPNSLRYTIVKTKGGRNGAIEGGDTNVKATLDT